MTGNTLRNGINIRSVFVMTVSMLPDIGSVFLMMLISMTAMIAPVEVIATSPKLSYSDA